MSCAGCGFDAAEWTTSDIAGTLRILGHWFDQIAEGAGPGQTAALAPYGERVVAAVGDHRNDVDRLHEGWHALHEAGRLLVRLGAGAPPATGRVVQLNVSGGGVPKSPVATTTIGRRGLLGDRQAARQHHGRPWQALCLWSAEVIDALAAEGHPIGYGSAGENVTVGGLNWARMRPGVQLRIGTALAETTPYAIPCSKNAGWFIGRDFGRMAHERQPGVSRIYARVLQPGEVSTGDPVVVEPEAAAVTA